jgi:hypothetical protein
MLNTTIKMQPTKSRVSFVVFGDGPKSKSGYPIGSKFIPMTFEQFEVKNGSFDMRQRFSDIFAVNKHKHLSFDDFDYDTFEFHEVELKLAYTNLFRSIEHISLLKIIKSKFRKFIFDSKELNDEEKYILTGLLNNLIHKFKKLDDIDATNDKIFKNIDSLCKHYIVARLELIESNTSDTNLFDTNIFEDASELLSVFENSLVYVVKSIKLSSEEFAVLNGDDEELAHCIKKLSEKIIILTSMHSACDYERLEGNGFIRTLNPEHYDRSIELKELVIRWRSLVKLLAESYDISVEHSDILKTTLSRYIKGPKMSARNAFMRLAIAPVMEVVSEIMNHSN